MSLTPFEQVELKFAEARFFKLYVQSWSDAARTIKIEGFTEESIIDFAHTTNADRSLKGETFDLQGIPLALEATIWATPIRNGECFVNLFLLAGGKRMFSLGSGYLSDGKQISWPPANHTPMRSGPGYVRSILGTDPAAGAEISETVPTNARWRLKGFRASLATSVVVANRYVTLVLDDGTNVLVQVGDNVAQTASTTIPHDYHVDPNPVGNINGIGYLAALPHLDIVGGHRIRTVTSNLDAGDNWGAPRLLVEEWLEE